MQQSKKQNNQVSKKARDQTSVSAQVRSIAEASNNCDEDCKIEAGPYFGMVKFKL